MSVADKILELRTQRENIREAIVGKGGTLPEGSPMANYAPAIYTIPAGGDPDVMSLQVPPATVTSLVRMFGNWSWVTTVPLFDTSSVTSMVNMFLNCTSLTAVPLFDTSSVTTMYSMFSGCTSLTIVPLFDTSKVTDMGNMFSSTRLVTDVEFTDCSKVKNVNGMFPTANNAYSALTRLILPGMGAALNNNQTLNVRYHKMDSTALDNLMTSLGTIMAGHTVTLDIRDNPGYDTCDKSIATDKGWTVL